MSYFDDAQSVLSHARESLDRIRVLYQESLSSQEVQPSLLIEIKHFLEDLRSALDYTAHGLVEKHGIMPTDQRQIQFPYAEVSQDRTAFERRIERRLPGLSASRPDVVDRICSYQHFANRFGNLAFWLPVFMELTNENKHRHLTQQDFRRLRWIIYSVQIPAGAVDFKIPFPFTAEGPGTLEAVEEEAFVFRSRSTPVLMFLNVALKQTEHMVNELSAL